MMSAILSDRLVFQLREREGLAYSLGCSFAFTGAGTYFAAGIGTRPQNIEKAIAGIEREIATFLDSKITQKELDRVRNSLVHRRRMRRLTSVNQAYFMGLSEFRGLGTVTEAKLNERLSKLTPDDLRAAARKYLKPARAVVVVAD
jgi:predicted Zn-dependent peptidase